MIYTLLCKPMVVVLALTYSPSPASPLLSLFLRIAFLSSNILVQNTHLSDISQRLQEVVISNVFT